MNYFIFAAALTVLATQASAKEPTTFPDIVRGHWCYTGNNEKGDGTYLLNPGANDHCGGGGEDFDITDSHMIMNPGVPIVCDLISGHLVKRPQDGMTSYRATLSCESDQDPAIGRDKHVYCAAPRPRHLEG
jgi:hypothetical protein